MANFPMFRLATLLARQLSTPIANKIKVLTRRHPRYSRSVCASIGRAFHAVELRFRMWALGLRQPRQLPPISDETALESGAYILGEMALFGIGGLIVVLEVNRQANKQDDKVLDEESQWLALLMSLEELQHELVLQQQELDRLHDKLRVLASPPGGAPAPPRPANPSLEASASPLPDECLPALSPSPGDEYPSPTDVSPPSSEESC